MERDIELVFVEMCIIYIYIYMYTFVICHEASTVNNNCQAARLRESEKWFVVLKNRGRKRLFNSHFITCND